MIKYRTLDPDGVTKTAQQIKVLSAMPDDLSFDDWIAHVGENRPSRLSSNTSTCHDKPFSKTEEKMSVIDP